MRGRGPTGWEPYFGWREMINWTLASPVAVALWWVSFLAQLRVFQYFEISTYRFGPIDVLDAILMGVIIGAAQAYALPQALAEHRSDWGWRTAITVATGFFMLRGAEHLLSFGLLRVPDGFGGYVRNLIVLVVVTVPIMVVQARSLREMQATFQGLEVVRTPQTLIEVGWVWCTPILVFLTQAAFAFNANIWIAIIALFVWSGGNALGLQRILNQMHWYG